MNNLTNLNLHTPLSLNQSLAIVDGDCIHAEWIFRIIDYSHFTKRNTKQKRPLFPVNHPYR